MKERKNIDLENVSKIRGKRKETLSDEMLFNGLVQGNKTMLSRAITLIESTSPAHKKRANALIERCLAQEDQSLRIGITGVPGVGKSTFIEAFAKRLTDMKMKVAVLAVDPTSQKNKGSIMGDKTRMSELSKNEHAFIRPSPSGQSLGGVARKTRETIMLCEAAGYDVVLVETVGVGQSETMVHGMVDFFLLLKLAGAGDELQGIKRGIIEMADTIVINKADGDNLKRARLAQQDFKRALQLYPPKENGWVPEVCCCSALEKTGISELWELMDAYFKKNKETTFFRSKRAHQNREWLLQTIEERLRDDFYTHQKIRDALERYIVEVSDGKLSPFSAAEQLLKLKNERKQS